MQTLPASLLWHFTVTNSLLSAAVFGDFDNFTRGAHRKVYWLAGGICGGRDLWLLWAAITGLADRSKRLHLLQLLNFLGIMMHSSQSVILALKLGLRALCLLLLQLGNFLVIVVIAMKRV